MTSPNPAPEATPPQNEHPPDELPPEPNASMQEYYQLQTFLFSVTLILTGIIFISVWIFYSLNIALNYLLGAIAGVVYLRLLARNVEQLGRQKQKLGKTQLIVFIGLIVGTSQWNELHIIPVFLGFLTYKVAILVYMFKSLDTSNS